jgi:flagellar hook protein FlgE
MFKINDQHDQKSMFNTVATLPEQALKRLMSSWSYAFYHNYFRKINETVFAALYSNKKSRPNVPVNILLGFETLKAGFGCSDEVMYERFLFDIQVRYALGLNDLDVGYFDLRTIYNFRGALTAYEETTGINLIALATQGITKEQMDSFQIKGNLQRMDSTLVQSNIRTMSRLQLVTTIIMRLLTIASEKIINSNQDLFGPYQKEDAQHFCYKVPYQDRAAWFDQAGRDLQQMLELLKAEHKGNERWQQALRVFNEHFTIADGATTVIEPKKMAGNTLQSPFDPEATYRTKNHESARGYVANFCETCDPDNELQLITSIQVQPNITDDQALLVEALPQLCKETGLETILTDGGYAGPVAAEALKTQNVTLKASAIKGAKRCSDKPGLEFFAQEHDAGTDEIVIRCPQGYAGENKQNRSCTYRTVAFLEKHCTACPHSEKCPAKPLIHKPLRVIRFTKNSIRVAQQRRTLQEQGHEIRNKRASVESTVRSVIRVFGGHLCKLAVRGKIRMRNCIQLSAMMVNVRRIAKYLSIREKVGSLA